MKYLVALGFLGMVNSHVIIESRIGYSCISENDCNVESPSQDSLNSQYCGTDNADNYTTELCVNECADRCFTYFSEEDTLGVIIVAPQAFGFGLAPGCWCTTTLIQSTSITNAHNTGTVQVDVSKAATDNSGSAGGCPTPPPTDPTEYINKQCCDC